ncbi:hypothetical protein K438DRAFT_1829517 [Mycena galopus ATCC 62051]|nr:hypothetical protein K438DRAFT_1829517 [Mycena galopus ATCC 62051]
MSLLASLRAGGLLCTRPTLKKRWFVLYLAAFKFRTPQHASGSLMDLSFAHTKMAPPTAARDRRVPPGPPHQAPRRALQPPRCRNDLHPLAVPPIGGTTSSKCSE